MSNAYVLGACDEAHVMLFSCWISSEGWVYFTVYKFWACRFTLSEYYLKNYYVIMPVRRGCS